MIKRNIKLFFLVLLVSVLTSCGAFKNVFKSKDKFKQNTEIVIDKKDKTRIEDKSIIVIEEKVDTTILVVPKTVIGISKPIDNLLDIQNLTLISDGLYTVRQSYDSLSKSFKTSLDIDTQKFSINKYKKTSINNNINTDKESSDNSNIKNNTIVKTSEVKKEGKNSFWVIVFGIGVVATILYFTNRYFKK